jgi:transketolase
MGKATREAYGDALKEAGSLYQDIIVLDADYQNQQKLTYFKKPIRSVILMPG